MDFVYKEEGKTTKTQRAQRLGSVIHLFDFFFYSSGYKQVSYYFQAFVLFVSLWFSTEAE
jgi:hypothetical protein